MTLEQMTNLKRLHFVTTDSLTFKFNDGKFEVGFFTPQEESINVENKWRIVAITIQLNTEKHNQMTIRKS